MTDLPSASQRIADAAKALGLDIAITIHDHPTRSAEEAALACGCDVAQIVKSLVFKSARSHDPLLFLVSGANRVDLEAVGKALGEGIERPDAQFVREITGFAIGGIPPFGHARPLTTYMDEGLLAFNRVWAAAGTPNTVFAVKPVTLLECLNAKPIRPHG